MEEDDVDFLDEPTGSLSLSTSQSLSSSSSSSSSSLNLIELALRLRWSTAAVRASENPSEIELVDDDGLTVLHWACCNQPPLRFLQELRVYETNFQRAACRKDYLNGMTPLLCACASQASPEIISFMIEACPESALLTDDEGWTALHYLACSSSSSQGGGQGHLASLRYLFHQLLYVHPTLALVRDSRDFTPIQTLCDTYRLELQQFYYSLEPKLDGEVYVIWEIVQSFLNQSFRSADDDDGDDTLSPLLHKIVSIPQCPLELVMVSCRLYPEQLMEQDDHGNTPLHLATQSASTFLASFLLKRDPRAASVYNHNHETPLCVARRAFQSWSMLHGLLLCAYPAAIGLFDMEYNIFPTLLSHNVDCATTIFEIFRVKPDLLSQG